MRILGNRQIRAAEPRRAGQWVWTLVHAQSLLAGPAAGADGASLAEDDYQRFAAARPRGYQGRVP